MNGNFWASLGVSAIPLGFCASGAPSIADGVAGEQFPDGVGDVDDL